MQRIATKLFEVNASETISFRESLLAPEQRLSVAEFSKRVASRRQLPTFTLSEAIHLPSEEVFRTKITALDKMNDPIYSKNSVDYDDFYVADMGETGYGLFAKRNIPANKVLFLYSGEYVKIHATDLHYGVTVNHGVERFVVDAERVGGLAVFLQHLPKASRKAAEIFAAKNLDVAYENVSLQRVYFRGYPYYIVISAVEILAGQIIGWDYGPHYFNEKKISYFTTSGSKIGSNEEAIKAIFKEKYPNRDFVHYDMASIDAHLATQPYLHDLAHLRANLEKPDLAMSFDFLLRLPANFLIDALSDNEVENLLSCCSTLISYFQMSEKELASKILHSHNNPTQSQIDAFAARLNQAFSDPSCSIYGLGKLFKTRLSHFNETTLAALNIKEYAIKHYQKGLQSYSNKFFQSACQSWENAKRAYKKSEQSKPLLKVYWNLGNSYLQSAGADRKDQEKGIRKLRKGESLARSLVANGDTKDVRKPEDFAERIAKYKK